MIKQGTDEWLRSRLGRVSGTRIGAFMGVSPWITRDQAILDMVQEIKTGTWKKIPVNAPMQWGRDKEPIALAAYQKISFEEVEEASIYTHPQREKFVVSPDGLIGKDGYLEIKCPYKYRNGAPSVWNDLKSQPHYYAQVQWGLYVTGRSWADFFQWAPSGEPHLERVTRDDAFIETMIAEAELALTEVEMEIEGTRENDPVADYDRAVEDIARLKAELKEAEGNAAAALDLLVERHGEGWEFPDGRVIEKRVARGSISYASIVKEHLPHLDLDEFRGDPRESWSVKPAK